ncbi:MAG: cellulase family glycosylhydrolase [Anaerolineales bacterium]
MRTFSLFLMLTILLSGCTQSLATQPPTQPAPVTQTSLPPTAQPQTSPALHRGINMGNMLEAPNEGEWGLFVQKEYFDAIHNAGFDFVRLPVRWNAHAEESAPYTIQPIFFARIDEVINWALTRNLTIIVNIHNYDELMSDPWSNEERFLAIWKQIAEHYKDYPSNLVFELMNEPNDKLDAALWNSLISKALPIVRESNPTRDVVIGPVQWNSAEWFSTLDLPEDPHLIATFHYYSPFEFTHQGAEWIGADAQAWLGNTWDATDAHKADVTQTFDAVQAWGTKHKVRILLGEFGAYSKAPQDSRVRWTNFVAREAENHGFAWAYWEFGSGFGAYDPVTNQWREDLLKALIP